MPRQSKFRGIRLYDGKWIYGNLIMDNRGEKHIVETKLIQEDGHKIHINHNIPIFFDQQTIGEFTGIIDKDDKDIYEHDIITFGNRKLLFLVEWHGSGFIAKPILSKTLTNKKGTINSGKNLNEILKSNQCIPLIECESPKVVGNIFNTPELLAEKVAVNTYPIIPKENENLSLIKTKKTKTY